MVSVSHIRNKIDHDPSVIITCTQMSSAFQALTAPSHFIPRTTQIGT